MAEFSRINRFRRITFVVLFTLAIGVSLLVFPNALLWMVAAWLAVGSAQTLRGESSWLPLAACIAVLLVKRPDWSPAMILLCLAMAVGAVFSYWFGRSPTRDLATQKIGRCVFGVIWLSWLTAIWESHESCHVQRALTIDPLRPVVCVGDSLTTGLSAKEAYPEYLQELVSIPVINFGRAGVTSRDMTKYLPDICRHHPQVVVIELGGHDFLRGYGRTATRESLVHFIEACQDAGADVVLAEIPRGFITDPFSGLERELARQYDLELIPDSAIRMLVVRSPAIPVVGAIAKPHYSDDGLHPNVAGAQMLADVVHRRLRGIYGWPVSAVRRPGTPPVDSQ